MGAERKIAVQRNSRAERECVRAVQGRAEQRVCQCSAVQSRECVRVCVRVEREQRESSAEHRVCQCRAESICVCVRAESVSEQRQSSAVQRRVESACVCE